MEDGESSDAKAQKNNNGDKTKKAKEELKNLRNMFDFLDRR